MLRKQTCLILMVGLSIVMNSLVSIHGESSTVFYKSNAKYQLQVIVVGNGQVIEGAEVIRDKTKSYELFGNDQKKFYVKADKNNRLKSVSFNGSYAVKNNSEIMITMPSCHSVLVITFENNVITDDDKEVDLVVPSPLPDIPDEKEIGTEITKKVPLEQAKDGISEEFLKSLIPDIENYKILSHNVQAKSGTYEIVIQLEDGSIKIIPVEIEGKNVDEEKTKNCNIHYYILLALLGYSCYMSYGLYKNKKYSKESNQRTSIKTKIRITFIFIVCTSLLFLNDVCQLDKYVYLFSYLCVLLFLLIAWKQSMKIEKQTKFLK